MESGFGAGQRRIIRGSLLASPLVDLRDALIERRHLLCQFFVALARAA